MRWPTSARGMPTLKSAPPDFDPAASTLAAVGSATALTIASPRPVPVPSRCRPVPAADEPVEDLLAHLGRDAGPVVGDLDDRLVALVRRRSEIVRAGRRMAHRVVEQVEHQPVQLVGAALDLQRPAVHDRGDGARPLAARPRQRRRLRSRRGRSGGGRPGARRRRGRAAAGRRSGGSSVSRSEAPNRPPRGPPPGRRCRARPAAARGWRARWSAACAARARRRRRTRAASASRPRARCGPRRGSAASPRAFAPVRLPRPRPRAPASVAKGRGWRRSPARSP